MSARLDLLELLADRLESEKRIPFKFSSWVGSSWKGDPGLSCGTAACAGGLATTMPEFQALGLRLAMDRGYPTVECDGYIAEDAMAHALGLTNENAAFLFLPNEITDDGRESPGIDATATEVAAHIRAFVTRKRTELTTTGENQP